MEKIIYVKEQVNQIIEDVLASGYVDNELIAKDGYLYITDYYEAEEIQRGRKKDFEYLGFLFWNGDKQDLKRDLLSLIREYNSKVMLLNEKN